MFGRNRFRLRDVALALLVICAVIGMGLYVAPHYQAALQSTGTGSTHGGPNSSSLLDRLNPATSPVFGANVRANSDASTFGQHEPSMAVSRTHPNTVVVASKDYRDGNIKHVWIDVSTDGGATWPLNRQLQMPGLNPSSYPLQSDPVVMARDDGRIYVACLGYNNLNGVFITWTDDDGLTWHNPSVGIATGDGSLDDKDWFAIDNSPASPYYHRMYIMYAPFGAAYVSEQHSTDNGLTWTARHQIGVSDTEYTYPVVGSDGTVYNFMMLNWGFGIQGTVQLTKSTDGGVTWSNATTVATADQPNSPIRGSDTWRFYSIITAAVDPNNGNLYAAWTDDRNIATNGTDVMYVRSTDHGATWSGVTRLSHDPTGVVRDHITPIFAMGSDSTLHALWLDRRNDPTNTYFQAWYSSSTDGGVTWSQDQQVSDAAGAGFDLDVGLPPGSQGAAGDYWGLDVSQNVIYAAWTDTRSGMEQDIYMSRGVMGGGGTPTVTPIPPTPSQTATRTSTATNTPTNLPTNTATITPTPSNTPLTPVPTATRTSTRTITSTSTRTNTPTITRTVTQTNTPIITPTTNPSASVTDTVPPTATTNPSATSTAVVSTATAAATASPTATVCTISFSDVPPDSTFYVYIETLACKGIINGYADGTFRPNNNVTRGQLSKIVSNSADFTDPQPTQMFEDVPVGSTFQVFIGRLASRDFINGYPCGSLNEPCGPGNLPYFRPNNNATRGQISKIVSNTAGFQDPQPNQLFEDVPVGSTFQMYIGRLASRGYMVGYPCGDPNEPCGPGNLPYFRPNNDATRGQTSKIVANTFFP